MFCALCAALISSNAALAQQMHADDLKWVNECRRTGSGIGHKSAVGQLYKRFDKASVIEAVMLSADRFGLPISTTLLEGGHWFTPEDVAVLTEAFERALGELGVCDRKDPAAIALAKLVIRLAKDGERDPSQLCDRAR